MEIQFTDLAKLQLKEITEYYKAVASNKVSKKIRKSLISRIKLLQNFSKIGPVEHFLENLTHEYRYLVEGNYKIIYTIENDVIYIVAIFDTRQDPQKMKV